MNNAVPQVKSLGSAHLLRARSWGKRPDSNPFTESPVTVWPEWR